MAIRRFRALQKSLNTGEAMIKIKEGYSLRQILDAYLVMGSDKNSYMPRTIMSVNETGTFLWQLMQEKTEEAVLVRRMTEEYEVSEETARRDVKIFLEQLREKALIEE